MSVVCVLHPRVTDTALRKGVQRRGLRASVVVQFAARHVGRCDGVTAAASFDPTLGVEVELDNRTLTLHGGRFAGEVERRPDLLVGALLGEQCPVRLR